MGERRIAMISAHASPIEVRESDDAGSQSVYLDEVSRHLGALSLAVDVFTCRMSPDEPPVLEWAPNVRVISMPSGVSTPIAPDAVWPLMPAFRDSMLRYLRETGTLYDLVHGHSWTSGWVATDLKRLLGLPAVQSFHATGDTDRNGQAWSSTNPPDRAAVERSVTRLADRVIAHDPEVHRDLVDRLGSSPDRISIVPTAVDIRRFRPVERTVARTALGLDSDDLIIGSIGGIVPHHDVQNVVRALALLRDMGPRVKLLVVGGDSERPDPALTPEIALLRDLAAQLHVLDRIIFTGRPQLDLLWLFYGAADVIVSVPWYEQTGVTQLQAMACARPVIGSDVGMIRFAVQPDITGYLVPPRNPAALARRLRECLSAPEVCRRLGDRGRQRVEQEFTWPVTARGIAGVYDAVLSEGNADSRARFLLALSSAPDGGQSRDRREIMPKLDNYRVAILATDGFEESELTEPRQALQEAGARADVVSLKSGKIQAFKHHDKSITVPVDRTLDQARPDEYDAVLLPGGALNADALRTQPEVKRFLTAMHDAGKPFAVICHAPWELISAGLARGKTMTGYHTIQDDIKNAGATWVDQEVCVDGTLVTSRQPDDLPAFNREMLTLFARTPAGVR